MYLDSGMCSFSYKQSLLKSHEKVETEVRAFCSEVDRVKELSRKVTDGATSLAFVSFYCCTVLKYVFHTNIDISILTFVIFSHAVYSLTQFGAFLTFRIIVELLVLLKMIAKMWKKWR